MLKIEAQLLVLKSYVDYELSTVISKIDVFSDLLKYTFEKEKIIMLTRTFFRKTLHPWKTN